VGEAVAELLAEGDGPAVGWLAGAARVGVGDGAAVAEAVGAGEAVVVPGAAVGWLVAFADTSRGCWDGDAAAIAIPAAIATMPAMTPAVSNSSVQEARGIRGAGPSAVMAGASQGAGLARTASGSGRRLHGPEYPFAPRSALSRGGIFARPADVHRHVTGDSSPR
jgi:hypothetical protein